MVAKFVSAIGSVKETGENETPALVHNIINMFHFLKLPIPRLLKINDSPSEAEAKHIRAAVNEAIQWKERIITTLSKRSGSKTLESQLQKIHAFVTQHLAGHHISYSKLTSQDSTEYFQLFYTRKSGQSGRPKRGSQSYSLPSFPILESQCHFNAVAMGFTSQCQTL